MKKKIALFLAAVMTFAVIAPMNLMAGSSATTTRKISGHGDDTLVPQASLGLRDVKVNLDDFADRTATGLGADLKITFNDNATPGEVLGFTVDLDNAEWAFIRDAGFLNGGANDTSFEESDFEEISDDGVYVTGLYYPGSTGISWVSNDPDVDDWEETAAEINANITYTSGDQMAYYIQVDAGYKLSARVQYATGQPPMGQTAATVKDAIFMIPLVIKTFDDGPVKASIDMGQDITPQDVTITSTSTGTRAKVDKIAEGTDEVELRPIIIEEYSANTMKNGKFKITAPKGYEFKVDDDDYPVKVNGSTPVDVVVTNFGAAGDVTTQKATKNGTVLNFTIVDKTATQVQATIRISGLVLQPIDDVLKYNTNLAITIEDNQSGDTKITKQTLDVAKFVKASILYSAKDSEDIKSGYRDQEVAKITMEEQTEDSWWARRDTTFTLTDANGDVLDGVKFTSGAVKTSNLNPAIDGDFLNDEDHKGARGKKSKDENYYFNDDGNVLTVTKMTPVGGKKANLKLRLT